MSSDQIGKPGRTTSGRWTCWKAVRVGYGPSATSSRAKARTKKVRREDS